VALALLLGWGVKVWAEGQKAASTNAAAGLTVYYPKGWLLREGADLAFAAVDPTSGEFPTTYQVHVVPIAAAGQVTPTLSLLLNNASLDRAQEGAAYRLYDLVQGEDIGGQPAMEANYAYVAESSDLFTQRLPVVVEGLDVAIARGDQAYLFSLLAAKESFQAAVPRFREFVRSVEISNP
jgi:hypothetical protein